MAAGRVQIRGMGNLHRRFNMLQALGPEAMRKALTEEANTILTAITPMVPMDTGALRKSGRVIAPRKAAVKSMQAIVRWGRASVKYAAWVHNMPDTTNWTTPGTGAHWVQAAFKMLPSLPKTAGKALQATLRETFPGNRSKPTVTITTRL